ncbi:MAG: hypothetical protein FWH21_04995 [Kiritimatiellaeota bacterium]|nr:hypothetical protein [Kiritimatiellota bacterium]
MFTAILASGIAQAQTNWFWTFKWSGDTYGLLFEDTALKASVKAAIRDDIAKAYAFAPTNTLNIKIYTPSDPEYGTFAGIIGLQSGSGCPKELAGGWSYTLHNGTNYFHVTAALSANYVQQIALTNQFKAAVGSLSNFLATVNSTTADNMNPADYAQLWWSTEKGRPLSLADFESGEEVKGFCRGFSEYYGDIIVSSILMFRQDADKYGGVFYCKTMVKEKEDGVYGLGFSDIIYRKGKWHLVLPEF